MFTHIFRQFAIPGLPALVDGSPTVVLLITKLTPGQSIPSMPLMPLIWNFRFTFLRRQSTNNSWLSRLLAISPSSPIHLLPKRSELCLHLTRTASLDIPSTPLGCRPVHKWSLRFTFLRRHRPRDRETSSLLTILLFPWIYHTWHNQSHLRLIINLTAFIDLYATSLGLPSI